MHQVSYRLGASHCRTKQQRWRESDATRCFFTWEFQGMAGICRRPGSQGGFTRSLWSLGKSEFRKKRQKLPCLLTSRSLKNITTLHHFWFLLQHMSMWVKQCHWHHPFGHGKHFTIVFPTWHPHWFTGRIPVATWWQRWPPLPISWPIARMAISGASRPMGIKRATPQKSTFDADLRLSRGGWDDEKDGRIYIYGSVSKPIVPL